MKPRLRHLLAAAFMIVATVPVLFLGLWVERTAMKKELAAVADKHLLLARNITSALDRYVEDAESAFQFFVETGKDGVLAPAAVDLARRIGFRHFSIIDADGRVHSGFGAEDQPGDGLPAKILDDLGPRLAPGNTVFSDVTADSRGRPTILIARRMDKGRTAVGALKLDYIRTLQKSIAFGRKGHSAIVDGRGTIIAHPNTAWQAEMKNIAKVEPVRRMMAGEMGVTTFYSPAVKKDMISGFTTVSRTGWGVMVPQPLDELEDEAVDVKLAALAFVTMGLVAAAVLSWVLSGLLVRPVEAVVAAAREIEGGNLEARVRVRAGYAPREFQELGTAFNAMARDIGSVMIQRHRVEREISQARDELERRVQERTLELTEEVAERKRAEALQRGRNQVLERLATGGSLEEVLALLVATIEEDNPAMRGSILLVDDDGRHLRLGAAPSLPDFYNDAVDGIAVAEGAGCCGTAAASGQVVVVEDVMAHPYWEGFKEVADRAQLRACWSQPILAATGEVLGTFAMYYREPRRPTPADMELIETAAQLAGIAIERKRLEDALTSGEERLRGAIESLQEGFALFDADDRLVAVNDQYLLASPAAKEIMGRGGTFEDVIRANVERGIIREAVGREEAFIRERIEQHRNPKGPVIRRFTDGGWYMIKEAPTPEGGIALSFIDITELKRAEEALTESRQRFKDLAEAGSDWFWDMDENLRFTYFSERRQALTGLPSSESVGQTRWEVAGGDPDEDEIWHRHRAILEAHEPFRNFEYEYTDARGRRLVTRVSGTPVFDEDGVFKGYRGTATDITEQTVQEKALKDSEERFKDIAEVASDWFWEMDDELRFSYFSGRNFKITGYRPEDLIGRKRGEMARGDLDSPQWRQHFTDLEERRPFHDFRYQFATPEGGTLHITISGKPIFDEEGNFKGYRGTGTDITARVSAEKALRESEERFRTVVDNLPSALFMKDRDGCYILVNRRYEEWYATTNKEIFGQTVDERFSAERAEQYTREDAEVIGTGKVVYSELESRFPDGKWRTTLVTKFPIMGPDGTPIASCGVETDITDRMNAEKALREAKDEAEFASRAKTEFLANMSHELRTPLNSVIGFSDILLNLPDGAATDAKVREYVKDINESGNHLLHLINDILDVARIERGLLALNEKKLDVPLLVRSCERLVGEHAGEAGVKLSLDVSNSLPALYGDELRIKQIVLNLLSNAIKFTPRSGNVRLQAGLDGDERFQIQVGDDGIGIAPEHIKVALSDFGQVDGALTRNVDGAGLGLPLSRKLAELHGGELRIDSRPGSGTTVTVLFPKERTIRLAS